MKGLYFFQRYLPFVEIISLVIAGQSDVVSCLLPTLNFFFIKKKTLSGRRLCVGGYITLTQVRKIDPPYFDLKQMGLILCPALMLIGISASESKYSLHSLFLIVFIDI